MKQITEILKMICVGVSIIVLVLMCGCKTVKTSTDKHEEHNSMQETAMSIQQNGVGESIDKQTLTEWFSEWYSHMQQQHSQQDTEQIQEIITTTTDSTGTVTKTEHRTTNRSTVSQSTQNAIDRGQEYKHTIDSLSGRIEALEMEISAKSIQSDSDSEIKQTHKETKSVFRFPLWVNILIVAGFVAGLYLLFRKISLL